MNYHAPFDQQALNPNAAYVNGNPGTGTEGSIPDAGAIEYPQREIINVVTAAGETPSDADLNQLLRAIRGGQLTTFTDQSGSANSIVIAPGVAHIAIAKGLPFRIFPAYTNTAAGVTLAVNSLSAPLKRHDGSALAVGDIIAGVPFDCVADGLGSFRYLGLAASDILALIYANTPHNVVGNPTIHVNSASGNDTTGDGTSAKPVQTIQTGLNLALQQFVLVGKTLVIQLDVAGTYAAPPSIPPGLGALTFLGNTAAQDNYVIAGAGNAGAAGVIQAQSGLTLQGVNVQNTGSITNTVGAIAGGSLSLISTTLSATVTNTLAAIAALPGGVANLSTAVKFNNSCGNLMLAAGGDISVSSGTALSTAAGVACSNATLGNVDGNITFFSGSSWGSSTVTGSKFNVSENGVVNTSGQGGSAFIPGSIAGTTATGGQVN